MIRYAIDVAATHRHTFAVELRIDHPAAGQRLSLPVWIPGSYLVREFARHLSALTAEQGGAPVPVRQLDKATWIVGCAAGAPLAVRYRIYAFDTSVRAAFLDASRGFFNGTSVCLRVEGRESEAHALAVVGLPEGWELATSLDARTGAGSDELVAADYDALVDHPVELGRFWRQRFEVAGVPHEFVVAGALPDFDGDRLVADTRRICEAEIRFWHGEGRAPFDRYLFLLNAIEDGRGGLEHRSSTALVAARRDLPRQSAFDAGKAASAKSEPSDGYVGVLGVIAHEYFHAWNVKRLRPRDFASFDYTRENYTELLWFFEGFTSYYDDLVLLRSGLIDAPRYLKLLATTMTGVQGSPGRALQSVAAASFDAWVKYYRADENTPNATISYYAKGSLVALALDLTLRSEGRGSLDDVMRLLWRKSAGGSIDENDIANALEAVGGRSFEREIAAWVHGTDELPLAELLLRFAVEVEAQPATLAQRLGIRVNESALTGVKVSHVLRDGAGERAGLASGDELIAAGGWRIRRLDDALRALVPVGETPLLVSRDQRLLTLALAGASLTGGGAVQLKPGEKADAEARRRFEAWIAG
ncbi:MAG TPA: PDZ domain-containing protein [Caldimonas sp.]|jgi:predicted metalloprotease with PDZ domain